MIDIGVVRVSRRAALANPPPDSRMSWGRTPDARRHRGHSSMGVSTTTGRVLLRQTRCGTPRTMPITSDDETRGDFRE